MNIFTCVNNTRLRVQPTWIQPDPPSCFSRQRPTPSTIRGLPCPDFFLHKRVLCCFEFIPVESCSWRFFHSEQRHWASSMLVPVSGSAFSLLNRFYCSDWSALIHPFSCWCPFDCFSLFTITNKTAIHILYKLFCCHMFSFLLGKYLRVNFWDMRDIYNLILIKNNQISEVIILF